MKIEALGFTTQKSGNSEDENEDAYHLSEFPTNERHYFFAIADGATEASYSKAWANQLVDAFCNKRSTKKALMVFVAEQQKQWLAEIEARGPLPWYAEANIRRGAHATFLGLHIEIPQKDGHPGKWWAIALGDCCLVQIRDQTAMVTFPLKRSEDFTNRPFLISSIPRHNNANFEHLEVEKGQVEAGDSFFLMTDALACWFLSELEHDRNPWEALNDLTSRGSFQGWIEGQRGSEALKNDDVTLLSVNVV